MKKRIFQLILVVLAAITFLLGGCGDSDETKGQHLLGQAETLLKQDNELQAVQVLTDLVAQYPETQAGKAAAQRLQSIQRQHEQREREGVRRILDSYQQVLDGYRSLYSEYPNSTADLDESDYFFDSAYLEEVTPAGYQVYLWLKSDGSGYSIWCVTLEKERGFIIENGSRKLTPFELKEALETIKTRFQADSWTNKLVILQIQSQPA